MDGYKCWLSPVADCFDGMVVSWTLPRSPGAAMADGMLLDAIATLGDGERPVIHSDRGCHYRWPGWIRICEEHGLTRSMSAKGCSPDNAAMEGFFGRPRNEFFHCRDWRGVGYGRFRERLAAYLTHSNETRIKKSLGWQSPIQYGKRGSSGFRVCDRGSWLVDLVLYGLSESSGVQEASGDVVAEVGEAEGDAAQVFGPAVDGFGGPVAGERMIEEGQDIPQAAFEGARQGLQLAGRVGGSGVDAVDELVHHAARLAPVGLGVAGDDLLVGALHDLQLLVVFVPEQPVEQGALPVGEGGVGLEQDSADPVQRVLLRAAPAGGLLLEALAALGELVAGEPDDVERVEDLPGVGGRRRARRACIRRTRPSPRPARSF